MFREFFTYDQLYFDVFNNIDQYTDTLMTEIMINKYIVTYQSSM